MQSWFPVDRCCVLQSKPTKAMLNNTSDRKMLPVFGVCGVFGVLVCFVLLHTMQRSPGDTRSAHSGTHFPIKEYTHIHTHLSLTYTPRIERWMELRRVDLVCFLAYTLGIFLVLIHVVFYLILLQQLQDCQCEFGARGYKLW
jgi:hypothetical protein